MTVDAPALPVAGSTEYELYMRTRELLSLQPTPERWVHRDELLWVIVHQTTELWLRLACHEAGAAVRQMRSGHVEAAEALLGRGVLAIGLLTEGLEMLRRMAPQDYSVFRPALGAGSGSQSPGWRAVRQVSRELRSAWGDVLAAHEVELLDLYQGSPAAPLYRLAEALVSWDERIALWRAQHYMVVARVIGDGAVGTAGMPMSALVRLIDQRLFPDLWRVRDEITRTGPVTARRDGELW